MFELPQRSAPPSPNYTRDGEVLVCGSNFNSEGVVGRTQLRHAIRAEYFIAYFPPAYSSEDEPSETHFSRNAVNSLSF